MEEVLEIIKFIIPALIVFGAVFYILKQFFDREKTIRREELKISSRKQITPLKMQAYERAVLYLERIDPNNMIMRIHRPGMSARMLHAELLKTVREEYVHNMAQQIYISTKGWKMLKQAKEETVKVINMAQNAMKETATGIDLSSVIFDIVGKLDRLPTEVAIDHLKKEFQKELA